MQIHVLLGLAIAFAIVPSKEANAADDRLYLLTLVRAGDADELPASLRRGLDGSLLFHVTVDDLAKLAAREREQFIGLVERTAAAPRGPLRCAPPPRCHAALDVHSELAAFAAAARRRWPTPPPEPAVATARIAARAETVLPPRGALTGTVAVIALLGIGLLLGRRLAGGTVAR